MKTQRNRIIKKSTEVKIYDLKRKLTEWERLNFEARMMRKYNFYTA